MTQKEETQRLLEYHNFDPDVLGVVSSVAEQHRGQSWDSFSSRLPENTTFPVQGGKPIEVLDVGPRSDNEGVQVYYSSMGNGLDENMRNRVGILSAAEPTKRIIAIGNPGAPGQGSGKLRVRDLLDVWSGDLRATVDPSLQYLHSHGIESATHVGHSFGADKAEAAAEYADKYDQEVPQTIAIDPASVKERGLIGLSKAFGSTPEALDAYVQAADSKTLLEARRLAEKRGHGMAGYVLGLARLSNVAIAHALTKPGFEGRVDKALQAQAEMRADIIWGTDSELAINELMRGITQRLIDKYGNKRIGATPIQGQRHLMVDDVFLHTALVLQAAKNQH